VKISEKMRKLEVRLDAIRSDITEADKEIAQLKNKPKA